MSDGIHYARLQPSSIFVDENAVKELLLSKGYGNFKKIVVIPPYVYVGFTEIAGVHAVRKVFDGMMIRGSMLKVYIEKSTPKPIIENEKKLNDSGNQRRSRTVVVRNLPESQLNDRAVYEFFWRSGYIKDIRIDSENAAAYIQFDTEDDAETMIKNHNEALIHGRKINIDYVADQVLRVPNVIIPVVPIDGDEQDALSREFQNEIRELL